MNFVGGTTRTSSTKLAFWYLSARYDVWSNDLSHPPSMNFAGISVQKLLTKLLCIALLNFHSFARSCKFIIHCKLKWVAPCRSLTDPSQAMTSVRQKSFAEIVDFSIAYASILLAYRLACPLKANLPQPDFQRIHYPRATP
jgi:hypothetical protein